MKCTCLLINVMQLSHQCVWLTSWLILLANDGRLVAKPHQSMANDQSVVQRASAPSASASPSSVEREVASGWKGSTLEPSSSSTSSSLDDDVRASTATKLTRSERLRRKMERKLRRAPKRQTPRRSKARSHHVQDVKTRLREDADGDWLNSAKNNNAAAARHYVMKSAAVAENDVLASGKADVGYGVGTRDLYAMMVEIEGRLLDELVRNRRTHETLSRHSGWLQAINGTVAESARNFSRLRGDVEVIQKVLESDDEYHRSIEEKLAGLMLDIAEMNNLLKTVDKRASMKLEDKIIPVESSPSTHCQHTANVTQYRDCEELYHHGHTSSGVYYITPLYAACPLPVYCDMETPPGGWMVFQRRRDGSTNFTRDWLAYRRGFGDVTKEFWLGNDNLFLLTNQRHYQLRVDLWDFYGSRVFAEYLHFKVDGERDRYRLHVSNHTGTAPDSLHKHNEVYFSTPDRDNDLYPSYHCAKEWEAGWWFSNCWFAILNGRYHNTTKVEYRGISWNDWKAEQLQRVEMKMRPSGY